MTRLPRAARATCPRADAAAAAAVHERAAQILRPSGALAWLDELAEWIAGWHRTDRPRVERPVGLIFAADHGVAAAEAVSAYPTEVTAAMFDAYRHGRSTISAFARQRRRDRRRPSTSASAARRRHPLRGRPRTGAVRRDRRRRRRRRRPRSTATCSSSARWASATRRRRRPIAAALGRWRDGGVGRARHGRRRRRPGPQARRRAAGRAPHRRRAPTRSRCCARSAAPSWSAIAAAVVAARHRSLPVVLDGYVVTASVLPLVMVEPGALDHCIVGHCSAEPGHRRLLERLGKRPLLDLDMRLGEGSGAMAAVPLVAMACAGITEVPTFAEWFGEPG